MSLIRYVQVHHLRLGSPLRGISGGPDWLKNNVADAVRSAVRSLFEVAATTRANFILFTGRLTDNPDDIDSVIQWLQPQLKLCAHHSVQLAMAVETPQEIGMAHRIGAIPLKTGEALHVTQPEGGSCQLEVIRPLSRAVPKTGVLISTDQETLRNFGSTGGTSQLIRVLATPRSGSSAGVSGNDADLAFSRFDSPSSESGIFIVPSVCPQAIMPDETGAMGCHVVEVTPEQSQVQVQFRPLDRVRYYRRQFSCPEGTGMDQVVRQLADQSRQMSHAAGRTCVVDWVIGGRMNITPGQLALCDENELLQRLRSIVQSGHHGAWPRRVLYTDGTTVAVCDQESPVIAEYLRMLNGRRVKPITDSLNKEGSRTTVVAGTDAVLGVELLARVA